MPGPSDFERQLIRSVLCSKRRSIRRGKVLYLCPTTPTAATHSDTIIIACDVATATTIDPAAAVRQQTATCHRRSPVRSECRPISTMVTAPARYGVAPHVPIAASLNRGAVERIIVGVKYDSPYNPITIMK